MKKVISLSIALITLFSCSKEEIPETQKDPIIGTWHLISENKKEVSDCRKQGTISFSEDKKFATQGYYVDESGKCSQDGQSKGTWSNKGNNVYGVKKDDDNEIKDIKITFINDSITLTYQEGKKTIVESYKKGTFKYDPPKEVVKNPILGTWYKFSFNDKEVTNCEKKSTAQFNEDNTYKDTPYVTDNGKCIIDGESSGTWKYKEQTYYFNGKAVSTIKFADNNNTLIVGEGTNEKIIYKREKTITPDPIVKDPIIGDWYIFSLDGNEKSDCEKKGTTTFSENGTISSVSYEEYNGSCTMIKGTFSAIWTNKGNGIYSIKNSDGKSTDANITFSDNGNTFTSVYTEKNNGTIDIEISVYKKK